MGRKRVALLAFVITAAVLAAAGCTGSDPLKTAGGDLVLQVNASPTLGPPSLYATMTIGRVEFRPDDPVADAELGTTTLIATPVEMTADLLTGTTVSSEGVSLLPGSYRVTSIVVGGLALNFLDASPPPSGVLCINGEWAQVSLGAGNFDVLSFAGSSSQPHFQVPPDGASTLTVTVRGDALDALIAQKKFQCNSQSLQFTASELDTVFDIQ